MAQPVDVEELGKLGRRKMVCPYYTARSAVPDAQLVLLPYSALLAQVSPRKGPKLIIHLSTFFLVIAFCIAIQNKYFLFSMLLDILNRIITTL